MSSPARWAVAAFVVVCLMLLLFRHKHRKDIAKAPPQPAIKVADAAAPAAPQPSRKDLEQQDLAAREALASRLVSAPLGEKLTVALSVKKRCNGGAYELIRREMFRTKSRRLLLTLESLDDRDRAVKPQVVEIDDPGAIGAGYSHTFDVPAMSKPTQFGLFLCKDDARADRCLGKEAKSPDAIRVMAHQAMNKKGGLSADATDVIYTFQYLILRNGRVEALPESYFTPPTLTSLTTYAAGFGGGGKQGVAYVGKVGGPTRAMLNDDVKLADSKLSLTLYDGGGPPCTAKDLAAFHKGETVKVSDKSSLDLHPVKSGRR